MLTIIIATLSMVQSLFGVGLLLFGTPTLLLLGLNFKDVLCILLPPSLTIDLLQLILDRGINHGAIKKIFLWALPPLLIGLLINIGGLLIVKIEPIIAALLILSALLRLSPGFLHKYGNKLIGCHEKPMLATIGLVHGATNMGGSLLSIYAAMRFQEKNSIRQNIVLGYALFATTQLIVLLFTYPHGFQNISVLMYVLVACSVFLIIGRRTFKAMSQASYQVFFTIFLIIYAMLLIAKSMHLYPLSE